MRRERDDALNQVAEERQKTFMAKKNFREEINKVNKKTNDNVLDMKNIALKNFCVNPVIFDRVYYIKRLVKYFHFLCTE